MHFKYLSQRGTNYSNEEAIFLHRKQILTPVETKLKEAIVNRGIKLRSRPLPAPGLHVVTPPALLGEIAKAQELVTKYRQWLEREGCVVDDKGNIDWARSTEISQVLYDRTAASQGLTKIWFQGGRLYKDQARTIPLDTSGMVTHFSGPGRAIYVMTQEGSIHVDSHSVGMRHHSSLLGGADVAGAGELEVKDNGQLKWLSNKSGHYAPDVSHLFQVLHVLEKNAVPTDFRLAVFTTASLFATALHMPEKCKVPPGDRPLYFRQYQMASEFLGQIDGDELANYELDKLLAYSDHLADPAILARNGWRWRQGGERAGVYKIGDNSAVDHKTVRQWLKSQGFMATNEQQSGAGR